MTYRAYILQEHEVNHLAHRGVIGWQAEHERAPVSPDDQRRNARKQARWRARNPELARQRAREAMRRLRAKKI